jgi:hypothetical protein
MKDYSQVVKKYDHPMSSILHNERIDLIPTFTGLGMVVNPEYWKCFDRTASDFGEKSYKYIIMQMMTHHKMKKQVV